MYSYKLNNSYTTYVNYFYLNECIKASREKGNIKKFVVKAPAYNKKGNEVISSLKPNTGVFHKKYGVGKVVSTDINGIMLVAFETKNIKFLYPDAIKKGFLKIK